MWQHEQAVKADDLYFQFYYMGVHCIVRAAIERLFKEHYEERKKSLEQDPSYEETLALFSKQMNELNKTSSVRGQVVGRRNNRIWENRTAFIMGIGAACVALLVSIFHSQ